MVIATPQQRFWQVTIVAFVIFEFYVAVLGLEIYFEFWVPLILICSLILRFSVLFVIGAFLHAYFNWQWHWMVSTVFAAPAVCIMFPKFLADLAGFGSQGNTRNNR